MAQAWEAPGLVVSFPLGDTTGIKQYRFVNISTAGNIILPAVNGEVVGVCQEGSTGSTTAPRSLPVMVYGISKVTCTASTVGVGQTIAVSSNGSPKGAVAASFSVGKVVAGTSGAVNRLISVLINAGGNSTALV